MRKDTKRHFHVQEVREKLRFGIARLLSAFYFRTFTGMDLEGQIQSITRRA